MPKSTLAPLTRVLNAAVRLATGIRGTDSVTAALERCHWLPIQHRIEYKLCLMMHAAAYGRAPKYIAELLVPISSLPNRERLRSHTSGCYAIPRVRTEFGRRAFSFAGPTAWNRLPATVRSIASQDTFRKHLKTHLFQQAYGLSAES